MINAKFDTKNPNKLDFFDDEGKWIKSYAIPPNDCGIDLIPFSDSTISTNYEYNFDGCVIITQPTFRKLYQNGIFICEINR